MKALLSLSTIYLARDMYIHYPTSIRLWLLTMIISQFVAPLFFLEHTAALWMSAAFFLGGSIMGLMHMNMGITKAMGIAHIVWLPGMALIYRDLLSGGYSGPYFVWLVTAAVLGTICLLIDTLDVIAYLRGNRVQTAPPAP